MMLFVMPPAKSGSGLQQSTVPLWTTTLYDNWALIHPTPVVSARLFSHSPHSLWCTINLLVGGGTQYKCLSYSYSYSRLKTLGLIKQCQMCLQIPNNVSHCHYLQTNF